LESNHWKSFINLFGFLFGWCTPEHQKLTNFPTPIVVKKYSIMVLKTLNERFVDILTAKNIVKICAAIKFEILFHNSGKNKVSVIQH
jgi:hypothetical protein